MRSLFLAPLAFLVLAVPAFAERVIPDGQAYSGGRSLHYDKDSGEYWIDKTDKAGVTTSGAKESPITLGTDSNGNEGLRSGGETTGPEGGRYRVHKGKLQQWTTGTDGQSYWLSLTPKSSSLQFGEGGGTLPFAQGPGEDGGTLPLHCWTGAGQGDVPLEQGIGQGPLPRRRVGGGHGELPLIGPGGGAGEVPLEQ